MIAATSIVSNIPLFTADRQLKSIKELDVLIYEL
jgi:predicted nucleic acid-binding protein